MKCTICGHKTIPGAMLCGPCRAALKRARYMSVQVAPPTSRMPRRNRSGAAPAAGPPRAPVAAGPFAVAGMIRAPGALARLVRGPLLPGLAAVAALAALGVAAYVAQPAARETLPNANSIVAAPLVAGGPQSAVAGEKVPNARAMGIDASMTLNASSPDHPIEPPRQPSPGRTLRNPPAPGRPAPDIPLSAGQGAEIQEPVPEVPRPAPPPPAPAVVPPPPDRWQSMRDDLSRCDREGGFGGFVCDQRVRLASCEGYWGRVPQCPLPTENPGGQ
jgi:hypothetical protein